MRVNLLLKGRLTGMGRQADCEVMAKRVTRGGLQPGIYTDPVIIHVGEELPEGEYTLFCENLSVPVLHKGVLWTVTPPPPPEHGEEHKPESGHRSNPARGAAALARRMIGDRRKKK